VFKHDARHVVLAVELELELDRLGRPVRYGELATTLGVGPGGRAPVAEVREAVLALRRTKGMVVDSGDPDSASAGSFFTNPVLDLAAATTLEARARAAGVLPPDAALPTFAGAGGARKVPAAWLIEKAGFHKGLVRGGVGTSRKHALALVNRGGGTTRELLALAREIRDTVQARFGVRLEPEVVLVGETL
jgi:UDP-N-acetylmuramate dehydrogenase